MDINSATDAFEALSNRTRLEVFRLLVRAGCDGLPAGEISNRLGVVQNTMSSHLKILSAAGIVNHERRGRQIIYSANYTTVRELILYLMEDCCAGSAAVREPVAALLNP